MSDHDRIEVETGEVAAAGYRTTATAEGWRGWGARCAHAFRNTTPDVHDPRFEDALADYSPRVVIGAAQVGNRVAELGEKTTAGAAVVDNADVEAATELGRRTAAGGEQGSLLARAVNYLATPV